MKKLLMIIGAGAVLTVAAIAAQVETFTIRQVRDPVQLRELLNSNAGDAEDRLAAVESTVAGGALASGKILVGDTNGVADDVEMSGDATIAAGGAVTLAASIAGPQTFTGSLTVGQDANLGSATSNVTAIAGSATVAVNATIARSLSVNQNATLGSATSNVVTITAATLNIANLPTSTNGCVVGQIWNSSGTLTVFQ